MRNHLKQVDWRSVAFDVLVAAAAIPAGIWTYDTDLFAQVLTAGLIGYGILLITYSMWEVISPESKARADEVRRLENEIADLNADNTRLSLENDRLTDELAETERRAARLQDHADTLEGINADLFGRCADLEQQASEEVA